MLRPWKLNLMLRVDRDASAAAYQQIGQALVDEIRKGRLQPGSVLPGTRELARELGVNRKTVINAYEELSAQGWLVLRGTKGTFVSEELPQQPTKPRRAVVAEPRYEGPHFRRLTPVRPLPVILPDPGVACLDDGTPDTRLFPVDAFARAYRGGLALAARHARLGYGDPRGALALRTSISRMLNDQRGLATHADQVCLTRGSQMALHLIARTTIRAGDAVVVEDLTYPPARETFRAAGAEIVSVRLDDAGIDVKGLEAACRRHRVRLVYVTPHHQFPTTVCMRPERRLRLMALADQFGFAVVEDDYDHEFHFQNRPLLPLASAEPSKVFYVGSMSKILAPGVRVGFLVAPAKVITRMAAEVMLLDRQGDPATEHAVADLIDSGELRRHVRKCLREYAIRRDNFASRLRDELSGEVECAVPDGGLAFWLTFKDPLQLDRLETSASHHGLRMPPSRIYASRPDAARGLRIGFASWTKVEMSLAVRKIRAALS